MKEIYVNLDVERGFFGFPKAFEKQHFDDRLYRLKPDKSEYGDNWDSVQEAFGVAVAMLHRVWNNPNWLSLVHNTVRVLISFNSDYSTWKVDMAPYGIRLQEKHPNFDSSIEKEENQIFEKYGFPKKEPIKYEVSFRGRTTIMNEEQFEAFHKDIVATYPSTWPEIAVATPLR
jgi:hypothetical protein